MLAGTIRPRFRIEVSLTPDEIVERVSERLRRPDCPCAGAVADRHHVVELRVHERDRHFWSPTLGLTVVAAAGRSGSVVHGLIGPSPSVWTLFALSYLAMSVLLLGVGIFGLIQGWLGLEPWGLLGVPVLAVVWASMVAVSRTGQRLAEPQTALLRQFLEEALAVR